MQNDITFLYDPKLSEYLSTFSGQTSEQEILDAINPINFTNRFEESIGYEEKKDTAPNMTLVLQKIADELGIHISQVIEYFCKYNKVHGTRYAKFLEQQQNQ